MAQSTPRPLVSQDLLLRRVRQQTIIGAQRPRQFHALRLQIDGDHHGALQPRQLADELPHQALADDSDNLSDTGCGDAHGIEGDATQRGEASPVASHFERHLGDQVAPGQDRFAVPCSFSAVGHHIAHGNARHSGSNFHHDAGAGIPQHGVLAELGPHLSQRPRGARDFHDLVHLAQMAGVVRDLLQHALLMDARGFRAGANQGVQGPHQHVIGPDRGIGHFFDDNVFQPSAQYLLHGVFPGDDAVSAEAGRLAS